MSSFQLKTGQVMSLNRKGTSRKSAGSMTVGAIRHAVITRKLAFMVIGMAIGATGMPDRICQVVFVTGLAWHRLVLIFQWKARFCMVKIRNSPDCMKRLDCMALSAVLTEFILMNISMACVTLLVSDSCKLLKTRPVPGSHRMAAGTRNRLVLPFQGETGLIMRKFYSRLE